MGHPSLDQLHLRRVVVGRDHVLSEQALVLLRERLAARDKAIEHLDRQREAIEEEGPRAVDLLKAFVDKALYSPSGIDPTFWLLAVVDVISDDLPAEHRHLLRLAARRIHSTFSVPHDQRLAATRFLFAKVVTID